MHSHNCITESNIPDPAPVIMAVFPDTLSAMLSYDLAKKKLQNTMSFNDRWDVGIHKTVLIFML
jgi:hypothetical protein